MTFREEQLFDMTPKRTPKINCTEVALPDIKECSLVTPAKFLTG
jgi:hypothetical protein